MCRDTVTIQRLTVSTDSAGGVVETFADHITGQRAKVDRITPREGGEYGKRTVRDSRVVFMPGVVDVTESDRIVFGSLTFEVRGVSASNRPGSASAYTRADVELIR